MARRQEESQEGEMLHQSNSLFNNHYVIITGLLLPIALTFKWAITKFYSIVTVSTAASLFTFYAQTSQPHRHSQPLKLLIALGS